MPPTLPDARLILFVHEDDSWTVRVVRHVAAVAFTERAACDTIASLVDDGSCSDAAGVRLCVELARACDADRFPPVSHAHEE